MTGVQTCALPIFDFKKNEWYYKYSWTQEQENDFINWLSKFLMKNWKELLQHKLINVKTAKEAAQEFVAFYGWKIKD